jgi:hypothetical protein
VVEVGRENSDSAEAVPGVTDARTVSLDRFPIRTREGAATLSAWRLCVACNEGEGAIVQVDSSGGERLHRGEGVFLGWSEERLASAYEALRPASDESGMEIPQLG